MISDLKDLETYGGRPETINEHHWVKIFRSVNEQGYYVLVVCKKCGTLGRQISSTSWECCKPNGEWKLMTNEMNDSLHYCFNSLWEQIQ